VACAQIMKGTYFFLGFVLSDKLVCTILETC
jgi:hypothetical protein